MDHLSHLLDDEGRPIRRHTILGSGDFAVVIQKDELAIKMAIVHSSDDERRVESNRALIRCEQQVYQILQPDPDHPVEGVVPCMRLSGDTIELKYMSQGTLGQWLEHRAPPTILMQRRWLHQLAVGLQNIHARKIIHCDIILRNILLDGTLNAMITDFGAATVAPRDSDMTLFADSCCRSMWTDLFQLGVVFYSILTGINPRIRIYHGNDFAVLPPRPSLPLVSHLWAGQIIEDCWNPGALGPAGAGTILTRVDHFVHQRIF